MKLKIWLLAMFGSVALFASVPAWANETVDLNTATVKELQSVKGIGPKTAAAIVEHRNTHGNFKSVDELREVKGIGHKNLEKIRNKVRIGGAEKAMKKEKAKKAHHKKMKSAKDNDHDRHMKKKEKKEKRDRMNKEED